MAADPNPRADLAAIEKAIDDLLLASERALNSSLANVRARRELLSAARQALLDQFAALRQERERLAEEVSAMHFAVAEVGIEEQEARKRTDRAIAALNAILCEPYGCSLCDSGKPRNPAKGHQPDCPFEQARAVVDELSHSAASSQAGAGEER